MAEVPRATQALAHVRLRHGRMNGLMGVWQFAWVAWYVFTALLPQCPSAHSEATRITPSVK